VNFDLHHTVGFFSSAFICVLCITGLLKAYGDKLQPFFDHATSSPVLTRDVPSKPPALLSTINLDEAVATAKLQLPGASLARIVPPKGKTGSWVVQMKFPDDSAMPGRSWVVIDQYSGAVLSRLDARTAPAGSKIPIVNRAIHVGGLYGVPTRILAFASGLAVLLQTVTGFIMWWRKRTIKPAASKVRESAQSVPEVTSSI